MGIEERLAQQQANGAPVLPSVAPMVNPPGYNYAPNVNGQYVVAPPGHPGHTNVPAGYQYPPGAVHTAAGPVEVPQQQIIQTTIAPPFSQTSHTPSPEEVDACLAAHPLPDAYRDLPPLDMRPGEPEKPKRTRRTKAEIQAEKEQAAYDAFGPPAEGAARVVLEPPTDEPQAGGLGLSVEDAIARYVPRAGIDGAVETLAARSKELGCDIQVNIVMKGGQS